MKKIVITTLYFIFFSPLLLSASEEEGDRELIFEQTQCFEASEQKLVAQSISKTQVRISTNESGLDQLLMCPTTDKKIECFGDDDSGYIVISEDLSKITINHLSLGNPDDFISIEKGSFSLSPCE